jgi:hypothetical protein
MVSAVVIAIIAIVFIIIVIVVCFTVRRAPSASSNGSGPHVSGRSGMGVSG